MAPLAVGGGVPGIVAKEVVPQVLHSTVKELPAGTRDKLQTSTAGKAALGVVEHGGVRVPTSPLDLAHLAIPGVKNEVVVAAIKKGADSKAAPAPATDHPKSGAKLS